MKLAAFCHPVSRWKSVGTVPGGEPLGSEASFSMKGPFSVRNPIKDDEPGPPLSQRPTGSVDGFPSLSTNQ